MNLEMKKLIESLNLSDNCKKELENSKLEKIKCNKDKNNYCFYINNSDILSIDSYTEFLNEIKKVFDTENLNVHFNVENDKEELLDEYFNYILDNLSDTSPMIKIFKDYKKNYDKHWLNR